MLCGVILLVPITSHFGAIKFSVKVGRLIKVGALIDDVAIDVNSQDQIASYKDFQAIASSLNNNLFHAYITLFLYHSTIK